MDALRRALLLVLLQDPAPVTPQGTPLQQAALAPLEELLLGRPRASELSMVLSSSLNLLRMLNSGAAVISGRCLLRMCVCEGG